MHIIKKYGQGFDVIYFDGKSDGFADAKIETITNGLNMGVNEEIISQMTGFSIEQIKEIKRKL